MSTPQQIEANRANAARSTGPASPIGKAASRTNALKLGLSGRGLILPEHEAELARSRRARLASVLVGDRRDAWTDILLDQIAVESVRIERCQQEERLIRERAAAEAAALWDEDCSLDALELGKSLPDDPEGVRIKLERGRHGVEWMIGRWGILGIALDDRGAFNESERALAFDLLGAPAPLRFDESLIGRDRDESRRVINREIQRLMSLRSSRLPLDEDERDLAEVGISAQADKRVKTIRRYESASRRAMEKSLAELRRHLGADASRAVEAGLSEPPAADYETNPSDDAEPTPSFDQILNLVASAPASAPEPAPTASHLNRKQRRALQSRRRRCPA